MPEHHFDRPAQPAPFPERRAPLPRATVSEALEACRLELERHLALGDTVETFRDLVAEFATRAHDEGVPPERALAMFKEMVFRLPLVEKSHAHERGEILRQLAQMAIESYYRDRDD